jgi:hypothetical protein
MSISALGRITALLPEVMALLLSRGKVESRQLISTGLRLGGICSWAIEQARFAQEVVGPGVAESSWQTTFRSHPPPVLSNIKISDVIPVADASVISYQAVTEAGESLRILASRKAEKEKIVADVRMIGHLVGLIPKNIRQVSKADLARLVEDAATVASVEADLTREADGLRLAMASSWFRAPGLVSHSAELLIETELAGVPFHQLPASQRQALYHQAVISWARMLLTDGILQVGLRRDRLIMQDGAVGVTRWAGTRHAQATSGALVRSLALSAFGVSEPIRRLNHQQASELLADGLGLAGNLTEIDTFCFSLISNKERLVRGRWHFSEIAVQERPGYSPNRRAEVLLLLRQFVWLRELGLECGVDDLTLPWRELARELEDG